MNTDKTTVQQIFQNKRRYAVPLFQRGYVWTADKQWAPLWDDLVSEAAEVARSRTTKVKGGPPKHFLGAIVLNSVPTPMKEVPVLEIIDGQQRLTTLQILLAAVRDGTRHLGNQFNDATLDTVTTNAAPLWKSDEQFKVWPTGSMQPDIRNVMTAGSAETIEGIYGPPSHRFRYGRWVPPRPGIVEAYLYFAAKLSAYLDDDLEELPEDLLTLDVDDRADVLVEALLHTIQLVTIELEHGDDAQVIFESLNARGEPLTPSDLIRNFFFLTASRSAEDVSAIYANYWREFDEDGTSKPFWRQTERQGRLKRSRLDLFWFHYITLKTTSEIKVDRLYQEFRRWWDEEPREVTNELGLARKYSAFYRDLLDPIADTPFGTFAQNLRTLDTTVAYPYLLWALAELGDRPDELQGITQDLESFFVRRMIVGFGSKSYSRLFVEWMSRMRAAGPPSRESLRAMLTSSESEAGVWPSDAEFRASLLRLPLYQTLKPSRVMLILESIERALHGKFAESKAIAQGLSVEHVYPQHPKLGAWTEFEGDEVRSAATGSSLVHTLGNLTLVNPPLNASLSNGPFVEKRDAIKKHSLLAINKYFYDLDRWDSEAIEARGRLMADLAVTIWPHPKS